MHEVIVKGRARQRHAANLSRLVMRLAAMHNDGMHWSQYVARVVGRDRQIDVARKTGIDQTTISRWLNPVEGKSRRISSQAVAAFARGYDRPVLEAFVIAGFLTEEEAGMTPDVPPPLTEVSKAELIAELDRRMSS